VPHRRRGPFVRARRTDNPGGTRPGVVVDINPGRIILMDITRAGDRLITVGERGFTLVSDDAGKSWRAVGTPVTRSLTRVAFENDKLGVAVGHGGSIVRTEDGGETWTAVAVEEAGLDSLLGVTSSAIADSRPTAPSGCISPPRTEARAGSAARSSPRNSRITFRRSWPRTACCGSFPSTARSRGPTMAVLTWVEVESPYDGSFFGAVAARDGVLLVFGMRGNIFRSADNGATWQNIEIGTTTAFNGGRTLSDGRIVLVGNAGLVARAPTMARRSRSSGHRPAAASRRWPRCRAAWSSPVRAASGCSIPRPWRATRTFRH
jgi:hypothetical protein